MNTFSRLLVCVLCVGLVTVTACRLPKRRSTDTFAAQKTERRQLVQKSVGLKQTEAQLQVARDAKAFGDQDGCLTTLEGILEREPGHIDALLLKAEAHLAKDELAAAERAVAIAQSHQPSNTTAKRLMEIIQTKQMAGRPVVPDEMASYSAPVQPAVQFDAAPLPGNAISPAQYVPAEVGTALVNDQTAAPVGTKAVWTQLRQTPFAVAASPSAEAGWAVADMADAGTATAKDTPSPASARHEPVEPQRIEPQPVPLAEPTPLAPPTPTDDAGSAEVSDQAVFEAPPRPPVGDFQEAIESGDPAAPVAVVAADMTADPDNPRIPVMAALAALDKDQLETAVTIARLGITRHPEHAPIHQTLAAALYQSGNYSASQVALQQALSLDNSSAPSYFLMGRVSTKLGDTEAAKQHFAKAAQLDPKVAESDR